MTQEELLLKDLCARLQYNVQILADIDKTFEGGVIGTLKVINLKKDWVELQSVLTPFKFDEIRPYLRPMSSMTEEEKEDYRKVCELDTEILSKHPMNGEPFPALYNSQDWLIAHHFDYRGLIERGLALEAPDGMYN